MKKLLSLMLLGCLACVASAQIVDAELATKPADETVFYQTPEIEKKNTFIVISKAELRLYVYGKVGNDTVLMAKFPACLSKNKGQKQRRGDMKTPECTMDKPFYIDAIKDASAWYHDFKDGRGSIKAYGAWFLRLVTPGHKGIGIHGSTNNEKSVPGRASEGCVRLRDADIILLKEKFAYINMPVIIKNETQGPWEWELKAHAKAVAEE
ncbi:MAG: L,D-transpeptidase [Muribaculaceae bacterium]|nr:L,D-transpeptidase [Muribaculaceae bacterium]